MIKVTRNSAVSETVNNPATTNTVARQEVSKLDSFNHATAKLTTAGVKKINALFGDLKVDLSEVAPELDITGPSIVNIHSKTPLTELFNVLASGQSQVA